MERLCRLVLHSTANCHRNQTLSQGLYCSEIPVSLLLENGGWPGWVRKLPFRVPPGARADDGLVAIWLGAYYWCEFLFAVITRFSVISFD